MSAHQYRKGFEYNLIRKKRDIKKLLLFLSTCNRCRRMHVYIKRYGIFILKYRGIRRIVRSTNANVVPISPGIKRKQCTHDHIFKEQFYKNNEPRKILAISVIYGRISQMFSAKRNWIGSFVISFFFTEKDYATPLNKDTISVVIKREKTSLRSRFTGSYIKKRVLCVCLL